MSSSLSLAKFAVQIVGGLGVTKVVNDVIANNTNVVTNFDAVRATAGSLVFGSIALDHASKHIEERFNQAVAWYEKKKEEDNDESKTD